MGAGLPPSVAARSTGLCAPAAPRSMSWTRRSSRPLSARPEHSAADA